MSMILKIKSAVIFSLFLTGCVSQQDTDNFDKIQAAKARVELGLGYLNQKDYSQAKLNLDKALLYAPDYYLVHSAFAYFYQVQGYREEAKLAYLNALKLDHNQGDVLNNYGAFLCSEGAFEQGKEQLMQALRIQQYYNQANTYENLSLCAILAKDQNQFNENSLLLEKFSPQRVEELRKMAKSAGL